MDLEKFFNEISPTEKKEKSVFFSLEQHLFYFITNEYEKHNKKKLHNSSISYPYENHLLLSLFFIINDFNATLAPFATNDPNIKTKKAIFTSLQEEYKEKISKQEIDLYTLKLYYNLVIDYKLVNDIDDFINKFTNKFQELKVPAKINIQMDYVSMLNKMTENFDNKQEFDNFLNKLHSEKVFYDVDIESMFKKNVHFLTKDNLPIIKLNNFLMTKKNRNDIILMDSLSSEQVEEFRPFFEKEFAEYEKEKIEAILSNNKTIIKHRL